MSSFLIENLLQRNLQNNSVNIQRDPTSSLSNDINRLNGTASGTHSRNKEMFKTANSRTNNEILHMPCGCKACYEKIYHWRCTQIQGTGSFARLLLLFSTCSTSFQLNCTRFPVTTL